MLAFGDVFRPLAVDILDGRIDVLHEQHLANLEVVSLRGEVETTASDRVLVVEIGPLVSQQQIDNPGLSIPTSYLERNPLLSTENVRVHEFLENQIVDRRGITNRAGDVQWRELVVTQHAEVDLDLVWFHNRHDLALFPTAVDLIIFLIKGATLGIQNPSLLDLILHYEPHELLFVTILSDHVTDFVDDEHIVYLFYILYNLLFIGLCFFRLSLRVFLGRSSKSRHVITVSELRGRSSNNRARRYLGTFGITKLRIPQVRRIRLGHDDGISSASIPTLHSRHLLLLLVRVRKQPNLIKEFPIPLLGLILLLPFEVLLLLVASVHLVLHVHVLGVLVRVLQQYSLVFLYVVETQTAFVDHELEFAIVHNI